MNYGLKLKKNDKRNKKFAIQRKHRGFDDSETWNLDATFVKFIVPRLRRFAKLTAGYPPSLTYDKWKEILFEIANGFEAWWKFENMEEKWPDTPKELKKKQKEVYKNLNKSLTLFKKYFCDFWW